MNNATIISGYSANLAFAPNCDELIGNLKQGKSVTKEYWFESERIAYKFGLNENKCIARLKSSNKSCFEEISQLIDQALEQAMLKKQSLSGENVRVYLTGLGSRIDIIDYLSFYDHNDLEDVTLNKQIKNLHAAKNNQDALAHQIAKKFNLKFNPPNLNCTSNSALSAVHLAIQAINGGEIDLVVVINYSKIATQDIKFLANQSMLESTAVQPFGEDSRSVLFTEGNCVMIFESAKHRQARGLNHGVQLTSSYTQISSGRGNDAAQLSANLIKTMNKALDQANISNQQLAAIIPHGNGSEVTDKAEAQAITTFFSEQFIPVLAYKGQIGYTSTGSGVIDLMIGHYSLCHGELISPVGCGVIRDKIKQYLLLNQGILKHEKHHLLKIGLGVDGSIIAIVMSNTVINS
ncbi:beta-ketoacyl synthase [Acinetobacter sp. ANC 4558]|uniref:beta-ketoacyl synthase N-terminal-like domain-containing protein n=1 Tax=Acinetobacter sp. ANC 4558 TaxID=1977876 RepID=UPI000A33F768|nr:beta-ketoacyl synthase N-terminal-like domain-containing protein [Acinetobacter sp. ANC 4558]OTG86204.1 beta-ketoacyl synthase [Acinetobacter sp. ANC 4558]